MDFFQNNGKEIVALLVPFITWLLNRSQRSKPRLIRAVRHSHTFHIDQPLLDAQGAQIAPNQRLYTASVVVHNLGNGRANNVEIVLNFAPMFINFWPLRNKTIKPQDDKRHVIVYDTLAAGEFIGFEMCSINIDLPMLVNVRSDEGTASEVKLSQYPTVAPWKRNAFRASALIGLGASVYIFLVLLQFLVLRTPLNWGG